MAFDLLTYAKERKKEAENSTQQAPEGQGRFDLMDYAMRKNAGNVANNISNRVNTWLKNHDTYISNYKSRFSGRKGSLEDDYVSDSGDWLKKVSQQKDNFKAEAESILSYMDQYKDYLNADFVRSVRDTLIAGTQQQRQIVTGATKDNEWWESFNDQNKYGKYGSAEEGYKSEQRKAGYQKTYEGMTSEEISDVIAKLDDGEEREWLTAYKPLVEYDENSKLDTNALQKEIEAMEQVYKEAESIALNSVGMGGQESDDYMRNQIRDIIGKFSNGQYSTMEELEKAIAQKKQKLTNASRVQEGIKLSGVADKNSEYYDPEFAKYTGYTGSTWIDGGFDRFFSWDESVNAKTGYEDIRYDFINDPDAVTDYLSKSTVSSDFHLLSGLQAYRNMTEDQVATYNYYYAKHGREAADKYLDSIQDSLNAKQGEKMAKPMEDKWLLQQVFGIAAGLDQFHSGLKNVFSNADYIPTSATQYASGYVRENLGENGGAFSQGVYDLITTGANMAPSILASAVVGVLNPAAGVVTGNALMGASAAGNAYQEVLNLGYGKKEARTYSTAIGVAEVALGSLLGGISKLGGLSPKIAKAVAGIDKGLLRFSLQYGGKMASEALEEGLQEILDPILKNAILHADEDVNWSEVAYSALLGGLSAGVWEGVGTARQVVKEQKLKAEYGDNTAPIIQEGLESDVGTESYELATEYKAKTDGGKTLTGAEIRQLLAANQEQIKPKDLKLIQQAAQKRLTDLGQTENVEQIAELATKFATGQRLSKEERSILARSEHGSQVSKDLLPENIWSEDTDTEWAEDIGTKVVNAAAYNKKKNLEKFEKVMEEVAKRAEETVNAEPATYKSLEERVGEDKTHAVSESGKATISGTDEEISLKNFVAKDVTANDMTIELENGQEVKASGIEYESGDQSYLFSAVPKIENITPAAATVAIKGFDSSSNLSVGEYLNGFDEGFTYGYWGYSEADLQSGNFAPKLGDTLMKTAYEMGKEARKSRKDTKTENIKKMRTAAQAEAEKAAAEGKKAPKAKNMTIVLDEGGGKISDLKPNKKGLSDKQRAGVAMAKVLQKMGLGTNFEFYASYLSKTMKDDDGNPVRVFINENGVEEAAPAGVYRKSDGTIRIDLNAYNGHQMTLNAMAHELTHFIQQWSDEKYQVLVDFLMEAYEKTDMTMHQRVLREQARLQKIRKEEVSYREAYDEVVANAMSKMLDDGMVMERLAELRAKDAEVANKLVNKIRKLLNEFFNIFKKESALFWDAHDLMQMKDTFEKLQNIFAEALVEASDNFQAAQTIGFEMDTETESISPAVMHSEQTWTESDYVQQRDKAAQEIAKAIGVTEQKAKDYIDSINSIAKMIAEDRSRLDYFSSPGRSSFVDNAEYGGSFDFSTLCKKRRLLTGTFTAIQKALPNTALTADEILDIRNRMKEADLEVSCGLCYVEGSRANMGQFAKEFLRLYKQYYPDAWQPNMADVNTPDGIEWVRINHPECYEQYEYFWNHYGTLKEGDKNLFASQQKPKLYQLHTEYKGEILTKFKNDEKVEDKNINGGIRLQSFSDFEIVHLIDTMQIIMDMSRVGLAGQAYTKVPDFAWALGDTGLKINLSLIAKGVDANGKLIFDDVEGMPIAEAMKLRDRYSKNVGTILVAFNDEQLKAAMADERVDFIIPFHRSQWKKSQYEAMGLPAKTKDYTFMQNEKYIKPQFHEYRGRMVKDKATNYMPNEYWDFSKSGKENAEAYLEMCARNNKRPKFYKLLQNNGDGSYSLKADGSTDGYWKLLIDFKMYDNEGNGSPQMAVKPDFNMIEANRMLNDYKGGHSQFPVAQGIVDDFVKDYKASHKGEQYSTQQTDVDRITLGMTDTERTAILQKKSVVAEVYEGQAEDSIKRNKSKLESGKMGLIKSALVRIGEEFKIFTDYDIADVDVKIRLSNTNIKESISKDISPVQIAKLLPVLKTAVENAIGIESHTNRYFYDNSTVYFENLLGGYIDGDNFVPVRFGLKHTSTGEATLYVIIDQQPVESKKIKAEVVKIPGTQNVSPAISRSAYKVNIADLANFVNGKDLLRYLPDNMLNDDQKKTKWEGIAETVKKTNDKNDSKYAGFIASGNLRAAQNMVKQAAKVAGYTIEAWHGSRHIFDRFSKEKLGSNTRTKASFGWFFAGDEETANSYYPYGAMKELAKQTPNIWKESDAEKMKNKGKLYALYLKMENPLIVDVAGYDYAAHAKTADSFMEYVEQAEQNGNDGIILYHVRDNQLRPSAEESTVYMFKEPSQAKSADPITYDEQDNVVPISERFNEKKDELRYSSQQTDAIPAPTFYSQMGKVVEGMKQEKFGANSVISMLRGRGVKAEEIRWSGIQAFLDGKKSVTKQELLDFINSSMLQIEEEERGEYKKYSLEQQKRFGELEHEIDVAWDEILELWEKEFGEDLPMYLVAAPYLEGRITRIINNANEEAGTEISEDSKRIIELANLVDIHRREIESISYQAETPETKWSQYKVDGGENYRELVFKIPGATYSNMAMQAHWGEDAQGVLAHVRMQDFDVDGKKMLFIEEIQSDWHNEGHNKGYESAEYVDYNAKFGELEEKFRNTIMSEDKYMEENDRLLALEEQQRKRGIGTTPNAPFKDNYHEFVLKRLIRMAAEEGYDSIGWTTADIQSDRWSDEYAEGYRIEYDQDIPKFLKKYGKQWGAEVGKTNIDTRGITDWERDMVAKGIIELVPYESEVWTMDITPAMKQSVLTEGQAMYSTQETDNVSNRSLLANAFEGITQNSEEYKMIQEYRGEIKKLNELDGKLSEINSEIRDMLFGKAERDSAKLKQLEEEANEIAKEINKHDKRLLSLETAEPLRKVIERERKKEAQKTKEHVKEIQQNKKLRAEQAELRYKIQNFKKKMESRLLKPTDRQYVPVDLIKAMIEVCNLIDTDTDLYKADGSINKAQAKRDETKENLQNLAIEYENLKTNSDPIYAGEFDEMVYTYLKDLRDQFSGKSLKEMSLDELSEMYEILRSIDETLADARKLIGWGDAESVYEAGDSIVAEQSAIRKKRKNGKRNAAQKGFDKIDNLGLSPVRNVERMSGYNQKSALLNLFKKFEKGIRKKNKFKMDAYKSFESLTSGKEYDDAIYKEVGGKKYTDIKGRKFGISKMQMMQAILSWERESANKHMHHIENGGFTFADLDMLNKGKLKDAVSAENSHRVPAAVEMVAEFNDILKNDKWCQDYMSAARKFFNGMAKDAINETSIALKHRIIAKDKNYIPFEVDTDFVTTEITDMNAVQKTINSYGMLKDTTDNAPQPLYVTGLNNILDRHIEQVGNIYGLAIEVRNFNKVWNVRSSVESGDMPTVKESIASNWGEAGRNHIEQAVKDIQGTRIRERSALYDKVKSNYISSTFLLNLSVVTKQIGSLFSATSMLRWRDPVRMIGNLVYTMANQKKISAEVDKYTATAWMRRQGMSDAELYTLTTQAKKSGLQRLIGKLPTIINPIKWITAMDHTVALSLWRYAKQDTAKKTGLKGEELLKATAEFYDEVVENTQSMTDVLHRPEIQKSGNVMHEAFAMFKTDLYQMAGQLQTTAGRYMENKSKENGKALARTVYSVAMGAVWGQLMTTVFALLRYKVDRYRDDDDEEEEITVESWLKRQGFGLAGDLMGYIFPIFGSEAVGIFENIMYGESDDLMDNISFTAINDLVDTMYMVGTAIKDGELPDTAKMRKYAAKALQVFTPIPANNILRTLDAIQLHAEDIANGEFLSFNAGVASKTDKLYDAIVGGDKSKHVQLKSAYVDKEGNFDKAKYDTAVRTALRENDPRIHEAAQARYDGNVNEYKRIFKEIKNEGNFTYDEIFDAINSAESAIKKEVEPENVTSTHNANDFVDAVSMGEASSAKAIMEEIISTHIANGKTQEDAEKEFKSAVVSSTKDAYYADLLDETGAKNMLVDYADMDEEDATSRVSYWDFCNDNPKYAKTINESKYNKYKEFAEPAGISLDIFEQYVEGTKGIKTIKDEWGDEVLSAREQVLAVIDSLDLTWEQKDALYLAHEYAESKIWDVPW